MRMSEDAGDADAAAAAASKAKSSKQGGVSDAMRAKLLKENQALGGDPDAPAINFGKGLSRYDNNMTTCRQ
jgi:hypothetical protein